MYFFWWSGRGYLTILIVLGTLSAFGVLQMTSGVSDGPWLWGSALLVAALANWQLGSKVNRKKLIALKPQGARDRLLYRARHSFMSLPMETFSLVVAGIGVAVMVWPFLA